MKAFLLIILTGILVDKSTAQISYSPVDSKIVTANRNSITEIICSISTMSIKFQLNRNVIITEENNFVKIDSQTIQITPLKFVGSKKGNTNLSMNEQRELLETYSKYELDFLTNDLNVEVKNPNNQWVVIKSKGWFIWYFRVGRIPKEVDRKVRLQLFASTVIGDNILTINAPILSDIDFQKAGLIINEMMETLTVSTQ